MGDTQRALIVGGGPVGLATAMLLARDGWEAVVVEKDAASAPASAGHAWSDWERTGVAQFRQAHALLPRFRQLVEAELPAVAARLDALGGRRFNLTETLPAAVRSPMPGDDRFATLTARRPVLESAFAQVAEDTPGVKIMRGVSVEGLVTGTAVRPGTPHVIGVRTAAGDTIEADLVVDGMGRRSKLPDWVTAVGGRPPHEEASDAGFAYYTRHYRSRGSVPEIRGPMGTPVGTLAVLTVPADNDTWTIALVPMAGDAPLKALKHNYIWERVVASIAHAAHWLDGEPLGDVRPMAGVLDRYRRIVVDGDPVVTGLIPIGDAWACTNPTAGRGISLGLAHAVALRDAVRTHGDDPGGLAVEFDRATEERLTPWYRQQVERDRLRAADVRAVLAGDEPAASPPDPVRQMQAAFFAAAAVEPEVSRAALEVMCCLALPHEVLGRPGMFDRVAPFVGAMPPAAAGPTREELVALAAP